MLLSKLLQFIVLLASLIASISTLRATTVAAENVYTVTPTTNLSPNLQYINTSQLRQKSAKASDPGPVYTGVYDRKTVRADKGDASKEREREEEKLDKSKEALKQLLDRRLIKSANDYTPPAINRTRTIERLVGGYLQYPQAKYNTRKTTKSSSTTQGRPEEDREEFKQEFEEFVTVTYSTPTSPAAAASGEAPTTTPWDLSGEQLQNNNPFHSWTSTPDQSIVSTTIFTSSTEDHRLEEEDEEGFEDVLPTTTPPPPQVTSSTRRSTTIGPRGATRHQYYDIRQNNSHKPSIKSPTASASDKPSKTTNPKIYFKRKNETSTTTITSNQSGARKPPTDTVKVPKVTDEVAAAAVEEEEEAKLISSNSLSSASHIQISATKLPQDSQLQSFQIKDHWLTDSSLEDAALLEIDQQLDNWDSGLLRASAGAGVENGAAGAKPESKKTLSDQVAEGKYGLIQTELFEKPAKRPGVLSYEKNPDTPKDTIKNLGGLQDDEIWLAEDHLLILKGGSLAAGESDWVPIDAYEAPQRQVKIPANPEVPPPFPVQLDENGPVQFIGNHQASFFGPFAPPQQPGYGQQAPGPYPPPQSQGGHPQNLPPWPGSVQNFTTENGYNYPPPPSPTGGNPFLNYGPPPPPPPGSPFGVGAPPPFFNGSLENANNTLDYPDEDDPSLYYPPPYSFVYKNNYSNPVPPGPLVPGIVLPPPPNFFTRLEGATKSAGQHGSNRTALRKRPPHRVPIVRPHQITSDDSPITKITKLTTTNVPPSVRRPTTTLPPTSTTTTTTGRPLLLPTRLVSTNKNTNQQTLYIPKYKDQENIVFNYEAPTRLLKPVAPEYEDHYQNTVEQPPPSISTPTVTQLKKVNDPLIRFVGPHQQQQQQVPPGNPIYFEYFDAQKGGVIRQPQHQQHRTSTPGPAYIPIQVSTTSTTQHPPPSPSTFFDYDKFAYVTPQPEIRPNGEPPQLTIHQQPDIIYQRLPANPLKSSNFNHEVETIRQTLNYYQAQPQLIPVSQQNGGGGGSGGSGGVALSEADYLQNQVQRTPKAKPVYQYSFDVTEGGNGLIPSTSPKYQIQSSIRPSLLDTTPFKPMVQYSAPLGSQADRDGFKPFNSYFSSSTPASIPVTSPSLPAISRPTKTRSKLLPILGGGTSQPPLGRPQQINLNGDHLYNLQFGSPVDGQQNVRGGSSAGGYLRNVKPGSSFSGYYYNNNNDQQQPAVQQQHHTATDPYMQQIAALRQKLRHHSTFHEFYQHPNYNHFNGSSSLRYYPGPAGQHHHLSQQQQLQQRPNSRFTDHPNFNQRIEQHQNLLSPNPQNTQYYSRIQTHPQTAQQQQHQQQQQQAFLSLEKDILVNYKYPLPAANPDAETLPAEFLDQHRRPSNQQRPNFFAPPLQQQNPQYNQQQQQFYQYRLPGDQAHVYFLAPQEDSGGRPQRQAKAMSENMGEGAAATKKTRRRRRR